MLLESGVVDEDVQSAKFLECLRNRMLAEFRVLYIAGYRQAFTPFGLDRFYRLACIDLFGSQVEDCHVRTFASVEDSYRAANSRITSSDDRGQILQLARTFVLRRIILGPRLHFLFYPGPTLFLLRQWTLRPGTALSCLRRSRCLLFTRFILLSFVCHRSSP